MQHFDSLDIRGLIFCASLALVGLISIGITAWLERRWRAASSQHLPPPPSDRHIRRLRREVLPAPHPCIAPKPTKSQRGFVRKWSADIGKAMRP